MLLFAFFCNRNIYVYTSIYIALLLLAGFRGIEVGTDTVNYLDIYRSINDSPAGRKSISMIIEPLWIYINVLSYYMSLGYQGVLFIGSFCAITPIFLRSWKSCEKPFWAILFYVLLYFYFNSFNITRQMIAVGIVYYALGFLPMKKWKLYFIFISIAFFFHYTAIISFLFPLVIKLKLSVFKILLFLILSYIAGLYIIPIVFSLLPFIGKYSAYIVDNASGEGSFTRLLLNIFCVLILIGSKKQNIYMTLFFVGVVFYNLFAFSSAIGRIALFLTVSQLILFSNFHSSLPMNNVLVRIAMIAYGVTYYILMLNANICEIVPYSFML